MGQCLITRKGGKNRKYIFKDGKFKITPTISKGSISNKKYVLKLFFQEEQSYKKELTLFNKLKDDVPVQKICLVSRNSIDGRTYIIYEYAEGKTISQHLKDGRKIDKDLIKSVGCFFE